MFIFWTGLFCMYIYTYIYGVYEPDYTRLVKCESQINPSSDPFFCQIFRYLKEYLQKDKSSCT